MCPFFFSLTSCFCCSLRVDYVFSCQVTVIRIMSISLSAKWLDRGLRNLKGNLYVVMQIMSWSLYQTTQTAQRVQKEFNCYVINLEFIFRHKKNSFLKMNSKLMTRLNSFCAIWAPLYIYIMEHVGIIPFSLENNRNLGNNWIIPIGIHSNLVPW